MNGEQNINFDKLLDFEKKSGIFKIQNDKGIFLWDIFHPQFAELYFQNFIKADNQKKKARSKVFKLFYIRRWIGLIKAFFFLFIDKRKFENMFFQASRNQYNGDYIDQNSYDTYLLKKNEKNLLVETFLNKQSYNYSEKFCFCRDLKIFIRVFYHPNLSVSDKFCIAKILELVNKYLPELNLTKRNLFSLLIEFYQDVFLYKLLFKNHVINKVFLTQNGFQKGLFYAAKKMNVTVYEFQHGVIRKEHLAYSYPKIENIQNYIYVPQLFLTFSDYWTNSFYCPIATKVVGNNYFSKSVNKKESNNVLVISAYSFGFALAKFIRNACEKGLLDHRQVIFKLHPHEYSNKDEYERIFEKKIKVLTNESSVNTLLCDCKAMITVNSTAAYEALQSGTRVLLYNISPVEQMKPILDDENLFLFSNTEEFENGLQYKLSADYKAPVFFEKCTPEKIRTALNINE